MADERFMARAVEFRIEAHHRGKLLLRAKRNANKRSNRDLLSR